MQILHPDFVAGPSMSCLAQWLLKREVNAFFSGWSYDAGCDYLLIATQISASILAKSSS